MKHDQIRSHSHWPEISRRQMLEMSGLGLGSLALNWLFHETTLRGNPDSSVGLSSGPLFSDLKPRSGHFKGFG